MMTPPLEPNRKCTGRQPLISLPERRADSRAEKSWLWCCCCSRDRFIWL